VVAAAVAVAVAARNKSRPDHDPLIGKFALNQAVPKGGGLVFWFC